MTANYLGRYSDHLWAEVGINPGVFLGLGPCSINGVAFTVCSTNANLNQRRKFSLENPRQAGRLGFVDEHNAVGWQTYQGLRLTRVATGRERPEHQRELHDRALPRDGHTGQLRPDRQRVHEPDDPDMDEGHCDQDRKHVANGTMGYQTPQFGGPMGIVASNWRVSGILGIRSGAWLNITTGLDNALNGQIGQRPNKVSDDVYGAKTLDSYLNRAAFAAPAPGTFGDLEYRAVEGPGYWTIDVALSRLIQFGGTQNIELRLESFNLTNNFNWGLPATNLNQAQFGRITTNGGAPRIMQFGIRYSF